MRAGVETGFAEFVTKQRAVPGVCKVTLVQFDSEGIDTVFTGKDLSDVPTLTLEPRGGTPLLDAVGRTISQVAADLGKLPPADQPDGVMVLIITDGAENASREYTQDAVKQLIQAHTDGGWHFIYLGANVDAFAEAGKYGVLRTNSAHYSSTPVGASNAFLVASNKLMSYRGGARGMSLSMTDEERDVLNESTTTAAKTPLVPDSTTVADKQ